MKALLLFLTILALLAIDGHAQTPAEPGHFDYYLLNLSWSPEFCATLASSPQCAVHPGFVLHGLWPQNRDGSWPANCPTHAHGPTHPTAWLDITPDLSLIAHEWIKHGACTTLDGDGYFMLARQAYGSITIPPRLLEVDHEITMTPAELVNLFLQVNPSLSSRNIHLDCEKGHLSDIEFCLGKDLRPVNCTALQSCQAKAIKIAPQIEARR